MSQPIPHLQRLSVVRWFSFFLAVLSVGLLPTNGMAQNSVGDLQQLQRVYVPDSQLENVAGEDRFGAVLSTQEFEQLLKAAQRDQSSEQGKPSELFLSTAEYELRIEGERLVGQLHVDLTVLNDAWHEARLNVAGWNIDRAELDGQPAAAARDGEMHNVLRVFVKTAGEHRLKLDVSSPLTAQGSDKVAAFDLAGAAAGSLNIVIPGGKHLDVAGLSFDRPAPDDEPATYVIPIGGQDSMRLLITDRKQSARADVLTFASTAMGVRVLPSEVTWIARTELQVFGEEIDQLTCLIPRSLEITDVESNGLESWELADVANDASKTQLTLQYRQTFDGSRTITFRGILSESPDAPWNVPQLLISNVTSHTGSVVIQHPESVRLQVVDAGGVRAVNDTQEPGAASQSGLSQVRYQIWDEAFTLRLVAGLKQRELTAAMTNILDVTQVGLNLFTTVSIETRLAPLFDFRVRMPADFEVTTIQVDGTTVQWETVPTEAGTQEIRFPLNPPLAPGQIRNVLMFARSIPDSWPVRDQTNRIAIPEVRLPQADMVEALYGIAADNDFDLVTQDIQGLDPAGLSDIEILNQKLQRLGKTVRLGFTYQDTVFQGQLDVSRRPATLSSETITLFRVDPETVLTRIESVLHISGGGYRELTVLVSEEAGEDLRFELLPTVSVAGRTTARLVEQIPGDVQDGQRVWILRFDRFLQGSHRLITEVQRPRPADAESFSPIRLQIPESDLVSGYLAVESADDEFVDIEAVSSSGEMLSVVDPADFPRTAYRPRKRVVARYRFIRPGWSLNVSTVKFDRSAVPTVIGHEADLVSVLSRAGELQHQATYIFTAIGAQSLLLSLPQDSELWSTLLDGQPVEIRQAPNGLQIPIAGLESGQHQLQLAWSSRAPKFDRISELQVTPPSLNVVHGQGETQPVEILEYEWQLHLPEESLVIDSLGRFDPIDRLEDNTLFSRLVDMLHLPTPRHLVGRLGSLGAAMFALLIIWLIARTVFRRSERVTRWKWVSSLVVGLIIISLLSLLLLPATQQARKIVGLASTAASGSRAAPSVHYLHDDVQMAPAEMADMELQMDGAEFGYGGGMEAPMSAADAESDELYDSRMKQSESEVSRRARVKSIQLREEMAKSEVDRESAQRSLALPEPAAPASEQKEIANQQTLDFDRSRALATTTRQQMESSDSYGAFPQLNESIQDPAAGGAIAPRFIRPAAQPANVDGGFEGNVTNEFTMEMQLGDEAVDSSPADSAITFQNSGRGQAADAALGRTPRRYVTSTGGLLSMTFQLQIPESSRTHRFHYQGNGVESEAIGLRVKIADKTTGQILVGCIALGVVLMGWWLRHASRGLQVSWITLTLLFPLAIAWVVPLLWQFLLEGVVCGGLATLVIWSCNWCLWCCRGCWQWFIDRRQTATLLVLGCLSLMIVSPVEAVEPTPPPIPEENESRTPFVVIPYESLEQIDAADRVWVPQDVYRVLWQAAHPEAFPAPDGPVPVTISEASYLGRVESSTEHPRVAIQARWVVSIMTDLPVNITLPIRDVAIEDVTINGEPAAVQALAEGASQVILQGRGHHIVDANLTAAAKINGSVGEFQVSLLPVGSGQFTFVLPDGQQAVRARVNGLEKIFRRIERDNETQIVLPIDRGGQRTIAWYPQTQNGGQNQVVQVETAVAAVFDDTGLQVNHAYLARVRQGGLNDMTFVVPQGLSVRDISGQDVGGWEVDEANETTTLKLFFRREITDQSEFHVNLFQRLSVNDAAVQSNVPTLTPKNVTRETVQLAVYAADHLQLRVLSVSGLNQIDVDRFQPLATPRLPQSGPLYAYRSSSRPHELNVSLQRRESEVKTTIEYGVQVLQRKSLIASRIVWNLTGSPRRRVDIEIPDDYLPISVVCAAASDWYVRMDDDNQRLLTIEFATPSLGQIEAGLEGHLPKQPDDANVEIRLPVPVDTVGQTATLGVWLDEEYRASIANQGDWTPIAPSAISKNYKKLDERPVQFAFRSARENPADVTLSVQTASPKLTGDAITVIAVTDATVNYGLTLRWNITQAATDELMFTVPNWLTDFDLDGPKIRQTRSEDAGNDRTRWYVSLVDPVTDAYLLTAAATIPAPVDQVIQAPLIEFESQSTDEAPQALQVQQQFSILANLSPNQLVPVDLEQFESISASELPFHVHDELVQQAMEICRIRDTKRPAWTMQRMEELEVAKAVVLSAHLESVLEKDGSWRTRATYGIRNRGRQFMALRLPSESRVLSVFVRGEPARTVLTTVDGQQVHLVALPPTSVADLSFDVSLLLAGRFDRPLVRELALQGQQFTVPAPQVISQGESQQFGMTVGQTVWTLHLPEDVDAKSVSGTAETNLTPHQSESWLAVQQQTLKRLQADVDEMVRIVSDKTVSKSRRLQAANNLKQLDSLFVDNYSTLESQSVKTGKGMQLQRQLLGENDKLRSKLEKAITEEVEHFNRQDSPLTMSVQESAPTSGRSFIELNNEFLIANNRIQLDDSRGIRFDSGFNFIQPTEEQVQQSQQDKQGQAAASRVRLKSQIAEQGIYADDAGLPHQYRQNLDGLSEAEFGRMYDVDSNGVTNAIIMGNSAVAPPVAESFGINTWQFEQRGAVQNFSGMTLFGQTADPNQPADRYGETILGLRENEDGTMTGAAQLPAWTSVGGLSIPMELPTNAQVLSFSKGGGNPVLTLSVRSSETTQRLWGLAWCGVALVVGLRVLRRIRRADDAWELLNLLANVALVIGLVAYICITGELGMCGFWLFVAGGFLKVCVNVRTHAALPQS